MTNRLEESLLTKNQIPIIDLSYIRCDSQTTCCTTMKKIANQVERCLREKGLALLVNHGIPQHKLSDVYKEMELFRRSCSIDRETFNHCSDEIVPNALNKTPTYKDRFFGCDFSECQYKTQYDDCYKEEYHSLDVRSLDEKLSDKECGDLRDVLNSLSDEFKKVSLVMLQALAMALGGGADWEDIVEVHDEAINEKNRTSLQISYSLRQGSRDRLDCCKGKKGDKVEEEEKQRRAVAAAAVAHKPITNEDLSTFTLLAQHPDSNFEVMVSENKWMKVGHLPGAILFHAGQHLQNWTCGKYKFMRYRIMTPEETLLQMRGGYAAIFKVRPNSSEAVHSLLAHLSKMPEGGANEQKHSHKRYVALVAALQQVQRRLKITKISNFFHIVSSSKYHS